MPQNNHPLAFLITFTTRGSWLHGDPRGSVDRCNNAFGEARLSPNPTRFAFARKCLVDPPLILTPDQRIAVADAITEVCAVRGWALHALSVRTQHEHTVASGDVSPERMMNDFKAYSTRRLRQLGLIATDARVWSRHGSTRWLFTEAAVYAACEYVLERQTGEGRERAELSRAMRMG